MSSEDEPLFREERHQQKVLGILLGADRRNSSIAYSGPILEQGRMDAVAFADGLKGAARLVNRIAAMHLSEADGFEVQVVGEPQSGSLEAFLYLFHPLVSGVENIINSKLVQELVTVLALSGFSLKDVGKSILHLYKKLHGRPIDNDTNLDGLLPDDLAIDTAELVRIYNDPEVQAAMRAALRPLRREGVEEFQTRSNGIIIERVTKADVQASDSAEIEAIVTDEEKVLDIEKVSFVEHLAWHLSDHGKPFDAKIEDPRLWKQIADGDRFGYGDRLHATVHTEAERDVNGRLRITKTVSKVHKIDHSNGAQTNLFNGQE